LINGSLEILEEKPMYDELESINLDSVIDKQEKSRYNLQRTDSDATSLFEVDVNESSKILAFSNERDSNQSILARFSKEKVDYDNNLPS
jgi:hypothetical protein